MKEDLRWGNDRSRKDAELHLRLITALESPGLIRRSYGEIDPTYLPRPKIKLEGKSNPELFVIMIVNFQNRRIVPSRSEADQIQADGIYAADYLADLLPGDNHGIEFTNKGMKLINDQNVALGGYVNQVMEAALERGILRKERREALFRSWYANQKKQERQ